MQSIRLNLGTATITGLSKKPHYFSAVSQYLWSIKFSNRSTLIFKDFSWLTMGEDKKKAFELYFQFIANFEKAAVNEGDRVAVLFEDDGKIIAISKRAEDMCGIVVTRKNENLWIDCNDGFSPKTFGELKIIPDSLRVF